MSGITKDLTVNDVILRHPDLIEVLNAFAVDTCCGGSATLAEAAEKERIELDRLLAALNERAGKE